jgi:hypothetical protein
LAAFGEESLKLQERNNKLSEAWKRSFDSDTEGSLKGAGHPVFPKRKR